MQTTTVLRKPRARTFDAANQRVQVAVGDTVKTAWGRGAIKRIGTTGRLYVRINDPGKFEHGRTVAVDTIH